MRSVIQVPAEVFTHPPHVALPINRARTLDSKVVNLPELKDVSDDSLLIDDMRRIFMMSLRSLNCAINSYCQVVDVLGLDR